MKRSILFLFIAAWIASCGGSETATNGLAKAEAQDNRAIDGEKIFKQYCVTCHGVYGDMGVGGAANLSESQLSVEERILVITNGRNTMASFSSLLSEEKIKAVAEYTTQLPKREE